jgi:type I restriction enzyme R subunit
VPDRIELACARFRDSRLDVSDCGAKGKKLIEDAVIAEGIQILVAKVPLFSKEFDEKMAALHSDEARASEMEHALREEIHVKLEGDPAFYTSLRERLERIVSDAKAKRIDAAKQIQLIAALIQDARRPAEIAAELGLTPTGLAVYGILQEIPPLHAAEPRDTRYNQAKKTLVSLILESIEPQIRIVDWTHKEDVQREMRSRIKRQLTAASYSPETLEQLARRVVELIKVREGR